jgi:hypothetical protein
MKLLSVDLAQSAWYGPIKDFNPQGAALFSFLTPWLANAYKLTLVPNTKMEGTEGLKFQDGEFKFKENELPISVALSIFVGGLIVNTECSTDASDAFLIDLFTKLSNELRIPSHESVIREKKYLSQLWVSMDKSFNALNSKLEKISEFLSKNVYYRDGIQFEVGGISFWPDQSVKFPPAPFLIERAAGIAFTENRYLSRAPLETDKHIELLNKLENILK